MLARSRDSYIRTGCRTGIEGSSEGLPRRPLLLLLLLPSAGDGAGANNKWPEPGRAGVEWARCRRLRRLSSSSSSVGSKQVNCVVVVGGGGGGGGEGAERQPGSARIVSATGFQSNWPVTCWSGSGGQSVQRARQRAEGRHRKQQSSSGDTCCSSDLCHCDCVDHSGECKTPSGGVIDRTRAGREAEK